MIARICGVGVVVTALSCGTASRSPQGEQPATGDSAQSGSSSGSSSNSAQSSGSTAPEVTNPNPYDGEPPLSCSMVKQACPSSGLPRFSTQLGEAGWWRLSALAEAGVVAVALGEQVELIQECRLPGRYHEAVAASDSPGRAWSSDRLVFVPDEVKNCGRATHFVASFAIRGDADGEAIALPLPCPPLGTGRAPAGCIGAKLDDSARKKAAEPLARKAKPLIDNLEMDQALPLALDLAALIPDGWGYMNLYDALRPLDQQGHGGCLWLSEAVFAVHTMIPDHESAIVDISKGRIAPSHEYPSCDTRPSLLTCFPERFRPGTGDNCW